MLTEMHAAPHTSFWIALLVGIASGSVGPFILLRRMALVGDALSHVALPGIALALIYRLDPFYGVMVFLIGAAFLVFWLEGRSRVPPDAIVGLLFTASLAIGILMIPNADVIESLFGAFPMLSLPLLAAILVTAVVLSALCFALAKRFLFLIVSPDLAKVHGLVGTLLMGALTIIPASIAKNLAQSMRRYVILSAILGGAISVTGVWLAESFRFLPGPAIVLLGVTIFVLSLPFARRGMA